MRRGEGMQVPARFDYEVAASVDEAINLLQRHGPETHLLAGGHSLIPLMKLRLAAPETVIDTSSTMNSGTSATTAEHWKSAPSPATRTCSNLRS